MRKKSNFSKMGLANVQNILKEYGVDSEEELRKKLFIESMTLPCIYCHKEFPIDKLTFLGDDPVCQNCK